MGRRNSKNGNERPPGRSGRIQIKNKTWNGNSYLMAPIHWSNRVEGRSRSNATPENQRTTKFQQTRLTTFQTRPTNFQDHPQREMETLAIPTLSLSLSQPSSHFSNSRRLTNPPPSIANSPPPERNILIPEINSFQSFIGYSQSQTPLSSS